MPVEPPKPLVPPLLPILDPEPEERLLLEVDPALRAAVDDELEGTELMLLPADELLT